MLIWFVDDNQYKMQVGLSLAQVYSLCTKTNFLDIRMDVKSISFNVQTAIDEKGSIEDSIYTDTLSLVMVSTNSNLHEEFYNFLQHYLGNMQGKYQLQYVKAVSEITNLLTDKLGGKVKAIVPHESDDNNKYIYGLPLLLEIDEQEIQRVYLADKLAK